jgi:hypothetical protein
MLNSKSEPIVICLPPVQYPNREQITDGLLKDKIKDPQSYTYFPVFKDRTSNLRRTTLIEQSSITKLQNQQSATGVANDLSANY